MRFLLPSLLAALLLPALPAPSARAAEPDDGDARAFMRKVLDRSGWKDMKGRATLTMESARGGKKVRGMELWSRKNEAGESSMLMRFVEPADVRGTGFLLIEHAGADDDRRLYLRSMRKVMRIAASGSGGNFMSSDFTYYDIGRPELAEWRYSFDGWRDVDGVRCRVVVALPASPKVKDDTGYSKIVWLVDPERLVSLGAEYFDEDGDPLKTLKVLKVEQIGSTPFATHMRMVNATTGHRSDMRFEDLSVDTGIAARTFTERNLRRWQ